MLKFLYPYAYVESVFTIDYEKIYEKGYKALIFDIDNTLVHHGKDSNLRVDGLFEYIHSIGFKTLLLSNNNDERIERFNKNIGTLYVSLADKPKTCGYYKAVEMLGVNKQEVLVIGDQIFTDVFGANRSGIGSILVRFIRGEGETYFGKRRAVENKILSFYSKSKKYYNRIGDISKREEIQEYVVE